LIAAEKCDVKSVRVSVMACGFYKRYFDVVQAAIDLLRKSAGLGPDHASLLGRGW